jgi:hypothetical protein
MEATLIIISGCLTSALVVLAKRWGKEKTLLELEVDELRERIDSLGKVIRRKNAYAKELETHLLESATSPDQLAGILTGLFTPEEDRGEEAELHDQQAPTQAQD